jgi:hypothetical protein
MVSEREPTPALGSRGEPASWQRGGGGPPGGGVAGQRGGFEDARWSHLFKEDTGYASASPAPGQVAEANRRMRSGPVPEVHGPFIKSPVWTWEVPLYFWFGGIAAGASFVALGCDLAGDGRSAATARKVALAALVPSPPLLIADLGRPERFLNMLRIFKPRSPMNTGAWCLSVFGALGTGAVAADLLGRPRAARALGGTNAVAGAYLGSYTGVLLASTAVPLWARSRLFLGPIFVSTATATGAAACRLTLAARGLPSGHPTRTALGTLETGAMVAELVLSEVNERRLGHEGLALEHGRAGRLFQGARGAVLAGLALRLARRRLGPAAHHAASVLYLAGGLAFRHAWVEAGKASAGDDQAVAEAARGRAEPRLRSVARTPAGFGRAVRGAYPEAVRRASLLAERVLRR